MIKNYLQSARQMFRYYKMLGEKTFDQLEEKDLFWQYNPQSNSIAIIVNHLSGNMKSRWTDFLHTDGEKTWRHRDREFEDVIRTKEEMMKKWQAGWQCLFSALDSIDENNFHTIIRIRSEKHTLVEAINRQLAHYASHIGQIVYIGRMIKGEDWTSLSIPKGRSEEFNRKMLGRG